MTLPELPAAEFDDELRQLLAADATSPPPPGEAITSERLQQRMRHKRIKALVTGAALVLTTAWISAFANTCAEDATADPAPMLAAATPFDAELDAISARLDNLLTRLAEPLPEVRVGHHHLRYELASARASALVSWHPESPSDPTPNQPTREIR